MVGESRLQEVPLEDWKHLCALFKTNWPRHVLPYLAIENYERLKADRKTNAKIWCLDGDWSDGTFILQDGINISIYTLQPSCERLYTALTLYDWSLGSEIHPFDIAQKVVVDRVIVKLKLKISEGYPVDGYSTMYWMSKEKSLLLDDTPPDDCEIRNLSDEDSTLINKLWPHGTQKSEPYIKLMIANNPTRGLYGKLDGKLRSWILSHTNGVLLALQTAPEHLRKGYAELTLKSMAKLKSQMGQDCIGCVVPGNVRSHSLFKKLNFTEIEPKYWTGTKPF